MGENIFKRLFLFTLFLLLLFNKGYGAGNGKHFQTYLPNQAKHTKDTVLQEKRIYTTTRTLKPPEIDGKLNDSCWKLGEWQSNFTQYTPVYRGKSSYRTDLKIVYDDKNIYVAIRAYDNMKEMTKRLARRDTYSGDLVGIQFDSYFDHRTAFEFDMTSAGQKIDCWVGNDGWDLNWNAIWYGKVAYEDSAWTVELQIPLSQLRYGSAPDQVWGLNSWRLIDRLHEEDHWNLIANDGTGQIYTFGELHGLKGLKKNRRLEIAPYISGRITNDSVVAGNPFARGTRFKNQVGLDAKIGITNDFTLDATMNPDFGQVEADPSVMNLTAFETFFEEKRPFFTEGKDIFDFTFDADRLFYSRRIGHSPSYIPGYDTMRMPEYTTIGGALKLSGKSAKGLSLGIMESITPEQDADIYSNHKKFSQAVEPLTNYFVGRFQQELDKGNTIVGGIITQTHRVIKNNYLEFLSKDALTYGLNLTRYWDDRKYIFDAKLVGSSIDGNTSAITRLQASPARYYQRPDIQGITFDTNRTVMNGVGISLKIGKWSKGHWRYDEEFITRSPGLELNDLGYMNIANITKNNTNISYVEKTNTHIFKTYSVSLLQQNAWDAHGVGLYSLFSLTAQSEFMNNWVAQITADYKFRATDEWLLRGGPAMKVPDLFSYSWLLQSDNSKKFYVNFMGNYNKGTSGNLNYFNFASQLGYRLRPNLLLSFQPTYQKDIDDLQYLTEIDRAAGDKTYLLGKVDNRNLGFAFTVDFALTPEFTIQYYGSPFVSIAKYSRFKEIASPLDKVYGNRFTILTPQKDGLNYHFDDNNDGITDYSIANPDFNFQQFRSNLVLRWEYKVGSTIYLVWTQQRTNMQQAGLFNFNAGYNNMFSIFPNNIFMIKFSYLFKS